MTQRFALVSAGLVATVSLFVGLIVAGPMTPAGGRPTSALAAVPVPRRAAAAGPSDIVSFADIAERVNPAVVNIEVTTLGRAGTSRSQATPWRSPLRPFPSGEAPDSRRPGDSRIPRRAVGSGFIIDADGHILTNHHVVDRAARLTVKLADGRSLVAKIVGTDPDTDLAVIRVDPQGGLPRASLGDSETLRVGDWVCAIGNPLAYEHTVTVGVVSYIGRKLFDTSLDNYIQTDAAITLGNSGGPLLNMRGEVVGINTAVSSRANNIGFAVPINQATAILPQLLSNGRVTRGYVGVRLKELDPDLREALNLGTAEGALVEDVAEDSPGERAGIGLYDVIEAVDDQRVETDGEFIRIVAAHEPGTIVRLRTLRDGREQMLLVKLAERPARDGSGAGPIAGSAGQGAPASRRSRLGPIGLAVRELDAETKNRLSMRRGLTGVIVTEVEPLSAAFDAEIERGNVILEINRRTVASLGDYRQATAGLKPGAILTCYVYVPGLDQRALRTIRVDTP